MATPPIDPERYRGSQRRRALIGWIGGFVIIAVVFGLAGVFGGDHHERREIKVPYGDVMTSRDFSTKSTSAKKTWWCWNGWPRPGARNG
jgi:hypothetical protein